MKNFSDVSADVPAPEPAPHPAFAASTEGPSERARAGLPEPFPDALRAAAAIAALSPSSHNCQPWASAWLTGDPVRAAAAAALGGDAAAPDTAYLALGLDRTHEIGALAAHAVEMRVSCGVYAQVLLTALEARGWSVRRLRLSDAEDDGPRVLGTAWPAPWTLLGLVELRGAPGPARTGHGTFEDLAAVAAERRTNRAPYRKDPVATTVLDGLTAPSSGAAHGAPVGISHLFQDADRAHFAGFVARYGGRDFAHGPAWRETHSFLRRDATEAAARGDGFTLEQLFGPLRPLRHGFLRLALSPRVMSLLRRAGYHRLLASRMAAVVRRTPVITAMTFTTDTPGQADMVRAGARLADYWLRATRAGLVLHPVSVVVQHDDVREALARRLGLTGRLFFVSRLGHPAASFPPAPRRTEGRTIRSL
ncbi:RedV protein [Streptomyces sp. NPDC002643]